jgi:hypothetical protein
MMTLAAACALAMLAGAGSVEAQGRGGRGGGAPAGPARTTAPVDLAGTWVSVVTEDWRWRMMTPQKGANGQADVGSIPANQAARQVANAWDPAREGACEAYGVGGLMRMPGRLKISWQDDNTLKIESDAGQQTRLLHFAPPAGPGAARAWTPSSPAESTAAFRPARRLWFASLSSRRRASVSAGDTTPAWGSAVRRWWRRWLRWCWPITSCCTGGSADS